MSKNYHNPISKPEMVTIPTWEYEDRVFGSAIAIVVEKLVKGLDDYKLCDVLKVLFDKGKGEEE